MTHYADYFGHSGGSSDEKIDYAYDFADRLIYRKLDPDGSAASALPIEESVYVYDGQHVLLQFDRTNGTGDLSHTDLSHRYLYGPAIDQVLADEHLGDDVY